MRSIAKALAVFAGASIAAGAALAHGDHHRHGRHHGFALGVLIGAPLGYHYGRHRHPHYDDLHYGYGYPYHGHRRVPPPPESVTAVPPNYAGPPVEARALLPNYSYFCDRSNAYYPDVTECAGGWTYFPPEPRRH